MRLSERREGGSALSIIRRLVLFLLLPICLAYPARAVTSPDLPLLRVGTAPAWPPFCYLDGEGKLAGFDADLRLELEQRLEVRTEVHLMPFARLIPALCAGEIDLIVSCLSSTPERAARVAFSRPYYVAPPEAFVVLAETTSIDSLAALRGKTVSCTAGSTHQSWLESVKQDLGIEAIRTRPNNDEALRDVLFRRADAAYTDGNTVRKLKAEGSLPLRIAFRHAALLRDQICIAVRKEDSELLQRINQVLARLEEDDTLQELRIRYDLE